MSDNTERTRAVQERMTQRRAELSLPTRLAGVGRGRPRRPCDVHLCPRRAGRPLKPHGDATAAAKLPALNVIAAQPSSSPT